MARSSVLREQNLGVAEFISAAQVISEGLPRSGASWDNNVQNPTYITTVWGYGYKWGF